MDRIFAAKFISGWQLFRNEKNSQDFNAGLTWNLTIWVSVIYCLSFFYFCRYTFGQETKNKLPSAESILEQIDKAEGFITVFMEMAQTITTSGGSKRTMVIQGWAINNGEKQVSVYLSPARIKGVKILILKHGDDIWYYSPSTRRTRKIASHARKKRVMGSDFTYEDNAGGNYREKYRGKTLQIQKEGGKDCYLLQLKPTPKGPTYDKILLWVGKHDYLVRRVDFFDSGEKKPHKRLILADVQKIGKKLVQMSITMTNLEDGGQTLNVLKKVKFNHKMPKYIFNPRRLGKKIRD